MLLPSTNALMTLPSAESERLILMPSLSRVPVAPVLLWRSLPAKSTRLSFPALKWVWSSSSLLLISMMIAKIE